MSLKEKLQVARGLSDEPSNKGRLIQAFGIGQNPFPPASQSSGHPRTRTVADDELEKVVIAFDRDHVSQAIVIEGTQGVGKTNLLSNLESDLVDAYGGTPGYYVIRYYSDPEPSFDAILRKMFLELGTSHLLKLTAALKADKTMRESCISIVKSSDVSKVLQSLLKSDSAERTEAVARAAIEWFTGQRLLNLHKELLGVSFRLDTVESKTEALRDIIYVSSHAGCLNAVYLLLDELEKQDNSLSKTQVLRYLSAIRALIDALPKHLFLVVALTREAKRRYFGMLPAFAGRLQNTIEVTPLRNQDDAIRLYTMYLKQAQTQDSVVNAHNAYPELISQDEVKSLFNRLLERSASVRAMEGVTQREFLNQLNKLAESKIAAFLKAAN